MDCVICISEYLLKCRDQYFVDLAQSLKGNTFTVLSMLRTVSWRYWEYYTPSLLHYFSNNHYCHFIEIWKVEYRQEINMNTNALQRN